MFLSTVAFVTVGLVVLAVGGVPAMFIARHRALRQKPAVADDLPLTDREHAALRAWEQRMLLSFAAGMAFTALMVIGLAAQALVATGPAPEWVYWCGLLLVVVIVGAAIAIQFSARCPRCGYNIGLQTRLLVPAACERCQTRFDTGRTAL